FRFPPGIPGELRRRDQPFHRQAPRRRSVRDRRERQSRDAAHRREGLRRSATRAAAMTPARNALDTPALVVDLDIMDANIARIAAACRESGVRWRPHIKGVKTPEIILRMLAAGAGGVTRAQPGGAGL